MAIAFVNRDTGANDAPGAGPQATGSVAFANNTLYLLSINGRGMTDKTITVSGGGLTWTKKASLNSRELWEGFTTSGASTGTVSISWTGTATCIGWSIDEATGIDTTTRIVQTSAVSSGTATSGTATLAAFGDPVNNVAFCFATHAANETSTPEAGYTTLTNFSQATTPAGGNLTEWKTGEDLSPSASWVTSSAFRVMACEVKMAAAAPPSSTPTRTTLGIGT